MIEYFSLMLNDKDFFMSNIGSFFGSSLILLAISIMLWMLFKIGKED